MILSHISSSSFGIDTNSLLIIFWGDATASSNSESRMLIIENPRGIEPYCKRVKKNLLCSKMEGIFSEGLDGKDKIMAKPFGPEA